MTDPRTDTRTDTRDQSEPAFVPSARMVAMFQELAAAADVGPVPDRERADVLETLRTHRVFLRQTLRGLTEEQARQKPTVSALSVGGLVTHVTAMEAQWVDFIQRGASAMAGDGDAYASAFEMQADDTVEGVLARYAEVAQHTDALVRSLPDLDATHPLPPAPWFRPGEERSARRVLMHVVAETSQHAGHADILRETLDGERTMG